MPKMHEADYFSLSSSLQHEFVDVVAFVKNYLRQKYMPDGFNVGQAAGQTVFYVHIHIIPRYKGDTPNPKGGVRHVIKGKGFY